MQLNIQALYIESVLAHAMCKAKVREECSALVEGDNVEDKDEVNAKAEKAH